MRDAEAVIDRYGVVVSSSEAPLSSMSGGNQQKVSMARWFELEPRLLLLDEPTQGVDIGARSAIHDFVRSAADKGCGVIVVSSDAQELAELCQRVVGLSNGLIAGEVSGAELSATTCTELGFGLTRQEADAAVIEESAS
jgi:ribose transport system ATP-binding protein